MPGAGGQLEAELGLRGEVARELARREEALGVERVRLAVAAHRAAVGDQQPDVRVAVGARARHLEQVRATACRSPRRAAPPPRAAAVRARRLTAPRAARPRPPAGSAASRARRRSARPPPPGRRRSSRRPRRRPTAGTRAARRRCRAARRACARRSRGRARVRLGVSSGRSARAVELLVEQRGERGEGGQPVRGPLLRRGGHEQGEPGVEALQPRRGEDDGDHAAPDRMDTVLDARGLACPLPAIKARRALPRVPPGAALVVLATDPEAPIDVAAVAADAGLGAGDGAARGRLADDPAPARTLTSTQRARRPSRTFTASRESHRTCDLPPRRAAPLSRLLLVPLAACAALAAARRPRATPPCRSAATSAARCRSTRAATTAPRRAPACCCPSAASRPSRRSTASSCAGASSAPARSACGSSTATARRGPAGRERAGDAPARPLHARARSPPGCPSAPATSWPWTATARTTCTWPTRPASCRRTTSIPSSRTARRLRVPITRLAPDPFEPLVGADVEPDADGDGYGDETQDCAPADPAVQTGCGATPEPPGPVDRHAGRRRTPTTPDHAEHAATPVTETPVPVPTGTAVDAAGAEARRRPPLRRAPPARRARWPRRRRRSGARPAASAPCAASRAAASRAAACSRSRAPRAGRSPPAPA